MATRMKVWLVALVGLCALVAAWAIPPSSPSRLTRTLSPEEVRYREAASEIQRAHGILVATRWSDSLSALVVETAVDGLALAHPPSDLVTPEGYEEWRSLETAHLASYRQRDPEMTVGIVFQADSHGALDGVPLPRFGGRPQTYVGDRDGSPYCFIVHPERYPVENSTLRSARMLDRCTWYAKYGVPGGAVGAWLEAGAFDFAREGRAADLNAVLGPPSPGVLPFGMTRPFSESIVAVGCLAGDAAACERAVMDPAVLASRLLDPPLVAESPMSHMSAGYFSPFQLRASFLLSELEARHGPEAFARFWKSDAAVPAAFEAAFGAEMGTWVGDWMGEELGLFRAGPGARGSAVVWSVLTVMLLGAFAGLKQMRRRVA